MNPMLCNDFLLGRDFVWVKFSMGYDEFLCWGGWIDDAACSRKRDQGHWAGNVSQVFFYPFRFQLKSSLIIRDGELCMWVFLSFRVAFRVEVLFLRLVWFVRGRLNVLHTILSKPLGSIITEFKNVGDHLQVGDVKYHLGTRGVLSFTDKTVTSSCNEALVLHLAVISLWRWTVKNQCQAFGICRFKYRFCRTQVIWKPLILLFWERLVLSSFLLETANDRKIW